MASHLAKYNGNSTHLQPLPGVYFGNRKFGGKLLVGKGFVAMLQFKGDLMFTLSIVEEFVSGGLQCILL